MAFLGVRVAVAVSPAAPTKVFDEAGKIAGAKLRVKNLGPGAVDLGDSTVATLTGYSLASGEFIDLVATDDDDELYAVCVAATTATLAILSKN